MLELFELAILIVPISRFPSGDPNVSCDPEFGEPIVLGVDVEPGEIKLGIPGPPPPHICGDGHGKPG